MKHTDTIPVTIVETVTDLPPSSDLTAKALRAVGVELDVVGEEMTRLAAGVETLAEMGDRDHAEQKKTLARIESKLDIAIAFLREHTERLEALERWRGDHVREHARQ